MINIECEISEYKINIRCGHFDICNNLFLPQGLTYLTKKYEKLINFKDETLRAHVLDDKSTAQTKVQIQIVEQLEQQLQKVNKQANKQTNKQANKQTKQTKQNAEAAKENQNA